MIVIRTRWFNLETIAMPSIDLGWGEVTCYARVAHGRLPVGRMEFAWLRPAGVRLARQGQPVARLAVRDATRAVVLGVLGLSFAIGLGVWWVGRAADNRRPGRSISG